MYRFGSPLLCGTLSFLASVSEWKPVTVRDLTISNKIYHNLFPGNACIFEEITPSHTALHNPARFFTLNPLCFDLSVLFSCLKSAGSIHLPLLLNTRNKITSRRKMRFCDHYYFECSYSRCALEIVESFHCKTYTHAKITMCNAPL